jgi:hypothetical protein
MRISQRDEPKKIPIPESPMNMKARMSAFEATSISSPPFVKKATQCKKAFPAPPLVDFLSSEDVSEANEISACDASTTSHTAPTSEDDSYRVEKSPEVSVDLDSSSDTFMMEESAGKTLMMEESSKGGDCAMPVQAKSCEAESDKVATTSHYSYSSDSFRHLDVCQEDGSLEEPFDRPLTLSWEDQRKMISRRDFPKKFPIPASPMGMKARMGAFEVKQVLSTPTRTPPLVWKTWKTSLASPSPVGKDLKTEKAIPAPPLVDDSNSEDTLTETAVDETSVCDAKISSHVVPSSKDMFASTSSISCRSDDAPVVQETCNVGGAGKTVQAKSCEAESDKVATISHYSYSSDSFRHLDVCQEDGSLETRYDRPLTLSWEDQRKMISRRDFPKKFPIPASPMGMKARMGAFEVKQVLSTPTTPLARNTSIASPSPVKKDFKTNRAIPAPPLVDDSISEDTLAETAFPPASTVDEPSAYDVGNTSMSDGAPVVFVNVEGTTEYSEERKETQPRVNCKPKHEHILAPYEEQQKALVQQRIRHSKNKVVIPKTPVKMKDRLSVFELEGKLNAPSSLNLDDDTCSLTSSNHSSVSVVW